MIRIEEGKNNAESIRFLTNFAQRLRIKTKRALYLIGQNTSREAKASMLRKSEKAGRIYYYIINGKSVRHKSSAKGQSNARLTGKLSKAINFDVVSERQMKFGYDYSVPYTVRQEIDLDRPTIKLAMRNKREANQNLLKDTVKTNKLF